MTTTEEQQLVIAAKKNDKEAFASLIQLNKQYMYKVALAILMNDEGTSEFIDENALQVNLTRLKKTLASLPMKVQIASERGVGYKLIPISDTSEKAPEGKA